MSVYIFSVRCNTKNFNHMIYYQSIPSIYTNQHKMGHDFSICFLNESKESCGGFTLERYDTHWPKSTHLFWDTFLYMTITKKEFIQKLLSKL